MPKLELWELKGKSNEDINKLLDAGELDHLLKDADSREKFTTGNYGENPNPGKVEPKTDDKNPDGSKKSVEPQAVNKVEEKPAAKKWGEYETPEQLFEALKVKEEQEKALREKTIKDREWIDKKNKEDGILSSQNKILLEEKDRLKKQTEELQKKFDEITAKNDELPELKMPDMPTETGDFMDPNSEYNRKKREFDANILKGYSLSKSQIKKLMQEKTALENKVRETEEKIKTIDVKTKDSEDASVAVAQKQSMVDLYGEISKLQNDFPELKTSLSFEHINEQGIKDNAYFGTLKKEDADKFAILKDMVVGNEKSAGYGWFDQHGIFHKNTSFDSLDDKYVLYLKKKGELSRLMNKEPPKADENLLAEPPVKREEPAKIIPNNLAAATGDLNFSSLSYNEKMARVLEFQTKWEKNTITPKETDEWDRLLDDVGMGGAVPANRRKKS